MQTLSILAGSSHSKKTTGSKASASPSTSSTSSCRKTSKETVSSKTGTMGITKGKKKTGKLPTSQPSSDATTSGTPDLKGEPSETKVETEQTVPGTEELTTGKAKSAVPPPPVAPPPLPPAPHLVLEEQCVFASDAPVVLVSNAADLPVPALDPSQLLWTEEPTNRTTVHSGTGLHVSRENAQW